MDGYFYSGYDELDYSPKARRNNAIKDFLWMVFSIGIVIVPIALLIGSISNYTDIHNLKGYVPPNYETRSDYISSVIISDSVEEKGMVTYSIKNVVTKTENTGISGFIVTAVDENGQTLTINIDSTTDNNMLNISQTFLSLSCDLAKDLKYIDGEQYIEIKKSPMAIYDSQRKRIHYDCILYLN